MNESTNVRAYSWLRTTVVYLRNSRNMDFERIKQEYLLIKLYVRHVDLTKTETTFPTEGKIPQPLQMMDIEIELYHHVIIGSSCIVVMKCHRVYTIIAPEVFTRQEHTQNYCSKSKPTPRCF